MSDRLPKHVVHYDHGLIVSVVQVKEGPRAGTWTAFVTGLFAARTIRSKTKAGAIRGMRRQLRILQEKLDNALNARWKHK